jgi:DNA-binding transcriptional MerR regulator
VGPGAAFRPAARLVRERAVLYSRQAVAITRNLDPAFATTEDIMAAAGIARRTVQVWVEIGLLPPPLKVSLGMPGGVFNRFPVAAVERARFIAAKRSGGYTNEEIEVMLDKMDAEEARKAKAAANPPAPVPATRGPSAPAKAARGGARRR